MTIFQSNRVLGKRCKQWIVVTTYFSMKDSCTRVSVYVYYPVYTQLVSFISELHSKLRTISRRISGLASGSLGGVWGHGWTTCLLYDGPLSDLCFNTWRPRLNGRLFPDDILKWIFLNENIWISFRISLKFVSRVRINNIPALVQIMAWRRPGDKPLSEPMMVSLLTHICVTRPQWVKMTVSV